MLPKRQLQPTTALLSIIVFLVWTTTARGQAYHKGKQIIIHIHNDGLSIHRVGDHLEHLNMRYSERSLNHRVEHVLLNTLYVVCGIHIHVFSARADT